MIDLDELRDLDLFDNLPTEHLHWFAEHAEVRELGDGDFLFREGDAADHMVIVLGGTLAVRLPRERLNVPKLTFRKGAVTGTLPYSRMTQYRGEGYATGGPLRLLMLHRDHFDALVQTSPELGARLVAIMSTRVREFAKLQQQQEKMMALGKLSAGLAHELNNPAAAIRRASESLQERIAGLSSLAARLAEHDLSEAALCAVDRVREKSQAAPVQLTTLERSEREDELADWLDEQGVEDGYLMAETFVSAGMTADDLEAVAAKVPATALADVLAWVEGSLGAHQILGEVSQAADRISALVASVKSYSHMDRAPDKQPTDLREGLQNTLTLLAHRFKKKNLTVETDFGDDVPDVPAYAGELNQVWTNLLDNAADALPEGGCITVATRREGPNVFVDVVDDGPGIPHDVQSRIFEPFFTTKGVGEGTGLGLDIAKRIVDQHGGTLSVASEPGRTVFTVCLPLEAREALEPDTGYVA